MIPRDVYKRQVQVYVDQFQNGPTQVAQVVFATIKHGTEETIEVTGTYAKQSGDDSLRKFALDEQLDQNTTGAVSASGWSVINVGNTTKIIANKEETTLGDQYLDKEFTITLKRTETPAGVISYEFVSAEIKDKICRLYTSRCV